MKVIIEAALLNDEEKVIACQLSKVAGADFVKTSTGFMGGGATVHEFWVSSDNVTFTKVATLNAQLTTNDGFTAMTDEIITGRYVKYLAVEGSNTFTHLSEINIYGTRE